MPTWTCERCAAANPAAATACGTCLNAAPAQRPATSMGPRPAPRAITALAVATVVLLVAGLVAVIVVGEDRRPEGRVAAEAAPQLDHAVERLKRFVARERGLAFKEPVDVRILDDDELEARLRTEMEEETDELEDFNRVARALGYIEPGRHVKDELDRLYGAGVLGLYDPEAKKLYVRAGEAVDQLTPLVEVTLVHELVHALQDQHFGLHRPHLDDADDESGAGFSAIAEGDAERIAERYRAQLPAEDLKAIEREEMRAAARFPQDAPPALLASIVFPYAFGPQLVERILETGGQARLDAAFADPPRWTEQILHPDLYLGDHPVPDVEKPSPPQGEKAIDDGRIGEFDLGLIFGVAGVADAQRAARGWGADRYVAWKRGDGGCVRVNLRMDTPSDATELAAALRQLQDRREGVTVTRSSQLTSVTLCG